MNATISVIQYECSGSLKNNNVDINTKYVDGINNSSYSMRE